MSRVTAICCELCRRARVLTFHHLIPRTLHRTKWFRKNFTRERMQAGIDICADCHSAIHGFISEKALGRDYNTIERLLEHPQLAEFVAWVSTRTTKTRYRTQTRRKARR